MYLINIYYLLLFNFMYLVKNTKLINTLIKYNKMYFPRVYLNNNIKTIKY
jgi:hypothetical protein